MLARVRAQTSIARYLCAGVLSACKGVGVIMLERERGREGEREMEGERKREGERGRKTERRYR